MYAVFCLCPKAIKIRDIKTQTIRGLIPRWTSTKYHSGPIDQVIQDIQEKIISGNRGLYTYHSNFSPNKSSVDDPYLLLVGSHDVHFLTLTEEGPIYLNTLARREKMIRLAVCDDEIGLLTQVDQLISNYNQNRTSEGKVIVSTFLSPKTLLANVEDGDTYDVYLLDIEMPDMDGLTLARAIKKYRNKL